MEDLKGKKLITIKILIDTNRDEFGFDTHYQGFSKQMLLLDQLMISGALDLVKKQVMSELNNSEVKRKEKDDKD